MERRGSGMKKIIGEYKRFENLENYHAPEFNSNASEFHVTMWNLNYGIDVIKERCNVIKAPEDVVSFFAINYENVCDSRLFLTFFQRAQLPSYFLLPFSSFIHKKDRKQITTSPIYNKV